MPERLGASQPSPSEGCDGIIAGADGTFRLASIVVGVKREALMAWVTADPRGVAGTQQQDRVEWWRLSRLMAPWPAAG